MGKGVQFLFFFPWIHVCVQGWWTTCVLSSSQHMLQWKGWRCQGNFLSCKLHPSFHWISLCDKEFGNGICTQWDLCKASAYTQWWKSKCKEPPPSDLICQGHMVFNTFLAVSTRRLRYMDSGWYLFNHHFDDYLVLLFMLSIPACLGSNKQTKMMTFWTGWWVVVVTSFSLFFGGG